MNGDSEDYSGIIPLKQFITDHAGCDPSEIKRIAEEAGYLSSVAKIDHVDAVKLDAHLKTLASRKMRGARDRG